MTEKVIRIALIGAGMFGGELREQEPLGGEPLRHGPADVAGADDGEVGGGGHDIASGATVPSKSKKKFLKELDRIVGEQLAAQ